MTTIYPDTTETRQSIIDACLWMGQAGINQGTSGNVSVRVADGLLITPSAVPYHAMTPDMICKLALEGAPDPAGRTPSTEWQFHQSVLRARTDIGAVVHAHPAHATAIATQRKPIPAIHYMIAIFGGSDVPVTDYALFGGDQLAIMVADALGDRDACLLANHGAVTIGTSLDKALWRMEELENLARIYALAVTSGDPVVLTEEEIAEVLSSIEGYGRQ